MGEQLVYRGEELAFELVEPGRTYSFDADGGLLQLASEAYRIRLAYLFDPYLAVTASQIEALPARSPPSTVRCCRVSLFASCWLTIPAPARPSWRAY